MSKTTRAILTTLLLLLELCLTSHGQENNPLATLWKQIRLPVCLNPQETTNLALTCTVEKEGTLTVLKDGFPVYRNNVSSKSSTAVSLGEPLNRTYLCKLVDTTGKESLSDPITPTVEEGCSTDLDDHTQENDTLSVIFFNIYRVDKAAVGNLSKTPQCSFAIRQSKSEDESAATSVVGDCAVNYIPRNNTGKRYYNVWDIKNKTSCDFNDDVTEVKANDTCPKCICDTTENYWPFVFLIIAVIPVVVFVYCWFQNFPNRVSFWQKESRIEVSWTPPDYFRWMLKGYSVDYTMSAIGQNGERHSSRTMSVNRNDASIEMKDAQIIGSSIRVYTRYKIPFFRSIRVSAHPREEDFGSGPQNLTVQESDGKIALQFTLPKSLVMGAQAKKCRVLCRKQGREILSYFTVETTDSQESPECIIDWLRSGIFTHLDVAVAYHLRDFPQLCYSATATKEIKSVEKNRLVLRSEPQL